MGKVTVGGASLFLLILLFVFFGVMQEWSFLSQELVPMVLEKFVQAWPGG